MLSLTQLAELEEQRRQLKRKAATVARDLRCAKKRRSKIMDKARNLTPNDLALLLAEKTAAQQACRESHGAITQSFQRSACTWHESILQGFVCRAVAGERQSQEW